MESILGTKSVEEILGKWKAPESLNKIPACFNQYPGLAVFLLVFMVISCVPFLIFTCFTIGSFTFLLASFILIEGTLLALGTCVLSVFLFLAVIAAGGVSVSFGTLWLVLTRWREIVNECQQFLDHQYGQFKPELTVSKIE